MLIARRRHNFLPIISSLEIHDQNGNSLECRTSQHMFGMCFMKVLCQMRQSCLRTQECVKVLLLYRLSKGEVTLKTLEQNSLPLDTALRNKKPTIVEFYANWCEICRELTPEVYKVQILAFAHCLSRYCIFKDINPALNAQKLSGN